MEEKFHAYFPLHPPERIAEWSGVFMSVCQFVKNIYYVKQKNRLQPRKNGNCPVIK